MKTREIFIVFALIFLGTGSLYSQGDRCSNVQPFCAGDSQLIFPNSNMNNSTLIEAEPGPAYSCLLTRPYPAWFYLKAASSGDLDFTIRQTQNSDGSGLLLDVDFIVWGPFGEGDEYCSNSALSNQNIIDCSYAPDAVERMFIPDALENEIYIVLITNFSGMEGYISLQQTNTQTGGSTDCSIVGNFLGPDQKNCGETPVVLDATNASASQYIWYVFNSDTNDYEELPGETGSTLTVTEGGNYQVTVVSEILNTEATDTILIEFFEIPEASGPATVVGCAGEDGVVRFDLSTADVSEIGGSPGPHGFNFYLTQQDYENSNPIPNAQDFEGNQSVILGTLVSEQSNCESLPFEITLEVAPSPVVNINEITPFCIDLNGIIVAPISIGEDLGPNYIYEWNVPNDPDGDGIQNPILILDSYPGQSEITLAVTDMESGCTSNYSTIIKVFSPPREVLVDIAGNDFEGGGYVVTANAVGAFGDEATYEYSLDNGPWQDSPVFTGVQGGSHRVSAREINGCGSATSRLFRLIGYPRFFTPNNDGYNDTWNVINDQELSIKKVLIFDRYGKLLKQLNPASGGWDGTYNGRVMPADDYWFFAEYIDPETNELQQFKGNFTLIK